MDDSRWPIFVITQCVDQLTDPERLASLEMCSRVLTSHGSDLYATVLDNRKAGPLPATQRKMMAEYIERNALRSRSRCVGSAFISDSAVMRAMLTAILWLRKPEVETQVFGDLETGIAWARQRLRERTGAKSSLAP